MAEGLTRFWWADLRLGLARAPAPFLDWGLGLWAAVLALLALGLFAIGGYHAGFGALNALGAAEPQWPWQWVTVLGDERVAVAVALLCARRQPRLLWALALGGLLGALYSRGLKPLVDAARPPAVLAADAFNLIGPAYQRGSFPSGHSLTAALVCGVGFCFTRDRNLRLALWVLALEVGLSRVVVGAHWPVDVLAGLAGGFAAAWLGTAGSRRWPWGVQPGGHLLLVGAAALFLALMLPKGVPYPAASGLVRTLGAAALVVALWDYGLSPWRCWRGRAAP